VAFSYTPAVFLTNSSLVPVFQLYSLLLILCTSSALSRSYFVTQRKVFASALIFEWRILCSWTYQKLCCHRIALWKMQPARYL